MSKSTDSKASKETEKFVRNVVNGKNIKAMKSLEKILQVKCSQKIAHTLAEEN